MLTRTAARTFRTEKGVFVLFRFGRSGVFTDFRACPGARRSVVGSQALRDFFGARNGRGIGKPAAPQGRRTVRRRRDGRTGPPYGAEFCAYWICKLCGRWYALKRCIVLAGIVEE